MDDLIYFIDDKQVLELINSTSSYTMNDLSIITAKIDWFSNENYCIDIYGHITFWDTGNTTNMTCIFSNKITFNELLLWNTAKVTNMSGMFCGAREYNQPLEFNTKDVTDMSWMFYCAISFNQPLKFNMSNVKCIEDMFYKQNVNYALLLPPLD